MLTQGGKKAGKDTEAHREGGKLGKDTATTPNTRRGGRAAAGGREESNPGQPPPGTLLRSLFPDNREVACFFPESGGQPKTRNVRFFLLLLS
jgi:hypothetical protein